MVKKEATAQIPTPVPIAQAINEEVPKASSAVEGEVLPVKPPKRTPVFLDVGVDVLARMLPLARDVAKNSRF